jgi:hypothetical protein
MRMSEFLIEHKEYSSAMWQCYDRYLNQFDCTNSIDRITKLDDFKAQLFPLGLQSQENVDIILRALAGTYFHI